LLFGVIKCIYDKRIFIPIDVNQFFRKVRALEELTKVSTVEGPVMEEEPWGD
jgi:hypothetical protein